LTAVLSRLQRGLETLYRVELDVRVDDFVIDAATRARIGVARAPREQLLVAQDDGVLDIGLFVDDRALANLARNDPTRGLGDDNLHDFLLTLEGVSHFVYLVWRARAHQAVSALELELQAEVDKYVTCVLLAEGAGTSTTELRRQLFCDLELADDLDAIERDRYRVANENGHRYSGSLERRFVATRRYDAMLAELRCFYRLALPAKLDWIRAG
jgi:hypothetical protein